LTFYHVDQNLTI